MTKKGGKPKGSYPRGVSSRQAAITSRKASESRTRLKDRIVAIEAEIRILRILHESLLDDVRVLMQRAQNLILEGD